MNTFSARLLVGEGNAGGLLGSEGLIINGDPVLAEGEALYSEGDPEVSAPDLKGCTTDGRRKGTPSGGMS